MEIHYKCTMWVQVKIDDDKINKKEIIKNLKSGLHPSEIDLPDAEWNVLYDTEEHFTPEENNNQATIDVLVPDSSNSWLESIWDNSIKTDEKQ